MANVKRQTLSLLRALVLLPLAASSVLSIAAQQTDVKEFDAFAGFTDLNAPALGLNQPGLHTQFGTNIRSWYALGIDYSVASGSEVLKPNLLVPQLQAELSGIPAQYLYINTDAFTQTLAAGPQLEYRHFSNATFFIRPSIGALREHATPHPSNPYADAAAQALAPSGSVTSWTGFYGVGGGGEYHLSHNFAIRVQMDAVYNHPFSNFLENGRWTYRFSVGPSFHFGHNILPRAVKQAVLTSTRSYSSSSIDQ